MLTSGFSDTTYSPGLYSDLNQLQTLRQNNPNDKEALKEVALQFEQVFLGMLLKSMRDANEVFAKDNPFNSHATRMFQDMHDQQLTVNMSQQSPLGLADIMVDQLTRNANVVDGSSTPIPNQDITRVDGFLNQTLLKDPNLNMSALLGAQSLNANASGSKSDEQRSSLNASQAFLQTDQEGGMQKALPARFDTPQEFVKTLMPLAEQAAAELGVDPKILLAQAALETGWGRYIIEGSHNLFNIKADARWQGPKVSVSTREYYNGQPGLEIAPFRSYASYEQSFKDYVNFLQTNPRYNRALQSTEDATVYVQELQKAGYATDPKYAQKIEQIYRGNIIDSTLNFPKEG